MSALREPSGVKYDPEPRAVMGFVCLPTDIMTDRAIPRMLSQLENIRWRMQRVNMDGDNVNTESYLSAQENLLTAADAIRPVNSVTSIALACTSLAFTLGQKEVNSTLKKVHSDAHVTNMADAVVEALGSIGAKRIAVLTPYEAELAEKNRGLLTQTGITITASTDLGLVTDEAISTVSQETIASYVKELTQQSDTLDAVFIACSAFNVMTPGFIDRLEKELGVPVITSLQALVWKLLKVDAIDDPLYGYGALLRSTRTAKVNLRFVKELTLNTRQTDSFDDVYPSRVKGRQAKLIDRIDPVVEKKNIDKGPLTSQQMLAFEKDGAMVLPQIFDAEEIAYLRRHIAALRDGYEAQTEAELANSTRIISESAVGGSSTGNAILKSIWEIHKRPEDSPHLDQAADVLYALVRDARLVNAARQILGEDVYIHQSRINFQQGYSERNPLGGTGFLWHQDFEQWHSDDGMPRMRAVSMAVLLDRNTEANASLLVMPGTHQYFVQAEAYDDLTEEQAALRLRTGPILGDHILPDLANRYGIRYCTGEPGDVVVFDCATLHGSHSNISPWPRQNAFFVYNAVSNVLNPNGGYDKNAAPRPEHIATRDKRYMGVPIVPISQKLTQK